MIAIPLSELTSLHSTPNPVLRAALAALPDYARAAAALAELLATPEPAQPGKADVAAEVTRALLAGNPVPADLAQRLAHDVAVEQLGDRTADVLHRVATDLAYRRDQAVRTGETRVLTHLADRLAVTLAALSEAATAGGNVTAEQSITAGTTDAFTDWCAAFADYQQIRSAQAVLVARLWPEPNANRELLAISNVADLIAAQAPGQFVSLPDDGRPVLPWPELGTEDFDRWVVTNSEAQVWLPTRTQFDTALDAMRNEAAERIAAEQAGRPKKPRSLTGRQV